MLTGRTVHDTAATIGRSRETVSRWKNENPHFQAELNKRRLEMFDALQNRMQSLAGRAIDVIDQHLLNGNLKAATELLKIINVPNLAPPQSSELDPAFLIKTYTEDLVRRNTRSTPFAGNACPSQFMKEVAHDLAQQYCELYKVDSPVMAAIKTLGETLQTSGHASANYIDKKKGEIIHGRPQQQSHS